jgi:hypothetical protein
MMTDERTFWTINTIVLKYMWKRGKSAAEIAAAIGTLPHLVADRLKELGLSKTNRSKYRFDAMSVGDVLELEQCGQRRAEFAARKYARRHGWRVICRNVPGTNIIRIQRVEPHPAISPPASVQRVTRNRNNKYRFHEIPVASHRDIETEGADLRDQMRVMNAAYMWARFNGGRVSCRTVAGNVVRVHRVA